MKLLILGASGMIGSTLFRVISDKSDHQVFGSVRDAACKEFFPPLHRERIISQIDLTQFDSLVNILELVNPDIVINCVGITKHIISFEDPLTSIPINSILPHRLVRLCRLMGARLIHISTDCVFTGKKGNYKERDFPDAVDIYGRSKILGEVDSPHAITLRTSTIGHELQTKYGLLEWFLSQGGACKGFGGALFSGLPTVVLAQIIRDIVIPRNELHGLYHVGAEPINKFELLGLIAECYQKDIEIIRDDSFRIDRSLNSDRFRLATGYEPPSWPELIKLMHAYK